jgi:hypothetical protein
LKWTPRAAEFEPVIPEDLAAAVGRLVLTRWVAALLMVGLTLLCVHLLGVPLPETELLVLAGLMVFYNAALAQHADWAERRFEKEPARQQRRWSRSCWPRSASTGRDARLLHLTGGISSPASPSSSSTC